MTEVVTKISINKRYAQDWYYIIRVLGRSFIEKLPSEKKGAVSRYKILKPLPTQEELTVMVTKSYTSTAEGLLDDAFGEFSALKEEVEQWKEAIEEKFSQTEKFSMLETACDALDTAENSRPDVPDVLDGLEIPVVYIESVPKVFRGRVTHSRQSRLGEALGKLQAVIDALNDTDALWEIKQKEKPEDETEKEDDDSDEDDRESFDSEVESYRSELESTYSEVEGVEFPGMFG